MNPIEVAEQASSDPLLPLDPTLLIFLKFFVVLTCIVFWLRLGARALMHHHSLRSHRRYR